MQDISFPQEMPPREVPVWFPLRIASGFGQKISKRAKSYIKMLKFSSGSIPQLWDSVTVLPVQQQLNS